MRVFLILLFLSSLPGFALAGDSVGSPASVDPSTISGSGAGLNDPWIELEGITTSHTYNPTSYIGKVKVIDGVPYVAMFYGSTQKTSWTKMGSTWIIYNAGVDGVIKSTSMTAGSTWNWDYKKYVGTLRWEYEDKCWFGNSGRRYYRTWANYGSGWVITNSSYTNIARCPLI